MPSSASSDTERPICESFLCNEPAKFVFTDDLGAETLLCANDTSGLPGKKLRHVGTGMEQGGRDGE